MNDNLIFLLKNCMKRDGLTDEQQLRYVSLFTQCESDAFINGRHFERDGKTGALTVLNLSKVPETDVFKQQELDYFQAESDQQRENIERWAD